jgi:hypothetical protein
MGLSAPHKKKICYEVLQRDSDLDGFSDKLPKLRKMYIVKVKVKVKVTLQLTVSQSVRLGVEPRPGLMTRYLFLF